METAQAGRQLNQCIHKCCEGFYMDVSVLRVMRSTWIRSEGNHRGSWACLQTICEDHNYLNICLFVRPPVCHHVTYSFPTGWLCIKFVDTFQFWLKSDRNNRHFIWYPAYVYDYFGYYICHSCLSYQCSVNGVDTSVTKVTSVRRILIIFLLAWLL